MHVTLVIAGGIVLLGLFLLFGKLWDAGYGLREELPILLLVFLVPAALAGVAIWLAPR
ncbi:hypothetical protein ISE34_05180 [Pseudomonas aeruginosa]|nr:hypothetical protein [Pseudomonas aeruginosa]MBX5623728.1 hypothetical protein [Pseudomonas aeruginosa]MBX5629116.1 hypothetical protein [Pseudomonas aeruginosa]MBX5672442.1 hypothetical protein [Pseudomonas aeruginosa]HBN8381064.1 hypothetical protein [Pseudomonas aeruginosa]